MASLRLARVLGHVAPSPSTGVALSSSVAGLFDGAGVLRHFVAFKFKETVNEEKRIEAAKLYLSLFNKCKLPDGSPYIVSMEGGAQNNKEGFDAGTQYGFIVTFKSAADRDYFVTRDPAPAEFRAFNKSLLVDGALPKYIFDFSVTPALSANRPAPPPPLTGAYPPALKADKDMLKNLEHMFLSQ